MATSWASVRAKPYAASTLAASLAAKATSSSCCGPGASAASWCVSSFEATASGAAAGCCWG
eukprot:2188085-Amphidinium_carterae.1